MNEDTSQPDPTHAPHAEEPDLRGTIFLTVLLMMLIFGFWAMMYLMLLDL